MEHVSKILSAVETYIKPQGVMILSLIGLLYAMSTAFRFLQSLSRAFLIFSHNLPKRYGAGSWVLITGGAGGIGAVFAESLAGQGFNIIIMDYNQTMMAETALKIEKKFPKIQVKTILGDFSKSFEAGFYDNLLKDIQKFDVSILINNVGVAANPTPFHETPEDSILKMLIINTAPMTIMSKRLIPLLLKRTNRSAIINVASAAGVFPVSSLSTYSATKAYTDVLSRMIEEDLRHKIDVLSVRPFFISTAMTLNAEVGGSMITPQAAVSSILGKLGRTAHTHGHWRHEIISWFAKFEVLRKNGSHRIRRDFEKLLNRNKKSD